MGYRVELEDGQQYDVDEQAARNSFPDLFPDAGTAYVGPDGAPPSTAPQMPQQSVFQQPVQGTPATVAPDQFAPFEPRQTGLTEQNPELTPPWMRQQAAPGPQQDYPAQQLAQLQPGQSVRGSRPRLNRGPPTPPNPAEMMGAMQPGYDLQAQGLDRMGQAQAQQAQVGYDPELGPTYDQVTQEETKLSSDLAQKDEHIQTEMDRYEADIQQKLQQIQSVDPKRLFKNASTFTNAMNAASAAIAGFLNPGQPNQVIENMMRQVDQDIEAQKVDIDTQRFQVGAAESAYGRGMQRAQMDRASMLEQRTMRIQALMNGIEREKGKYQSEIVLGGLEQMKGSLGVEMGKTYAALMQEQFQGLERQWEQKLDYSAKMAQVDAARKAAKPPKEPNNTLIEIPDPQDPSKNVVLKINPDIANTMEKGEFGKYREKLVAMNPKLRAVDDYIKAVEAIESVYGGPLSKWYNTLKSDPRQAKLYNEYRQAYNNLLQKKAFDYAGKTFSPTEEKIQREQLGDIDTWSTSGNAVDLASHIRNDFFAEQADIATALGGYVERSTPYVTPPIDPKTGQPTGAKYVGDIISQEKYQPGSAKSVFKSAYPPEPTGKPSADATKYGWRTTIARVDHVVNKIANAKSDAGKLKAQEELQTFVTDFANHVSEGDIPLDPQHEKQLHKIEKTLESIPPKDRMIKRNAFEEILGSSSYQENFPPELREVGDHYVDSLEVVRGVRTQLEKERDLLRNTHAMPHQTGLSAGPMGYKR